MDAKSEQENSKDGDGGEKDLTSHSDEHGPLDPDTVRRDIEGHGDMEFLDN